jgi:hypothetical protein
MSQEELYKIANDTTPEVIQVPNTWQGFIVWAIAKFGTGIVVAGVFGWGIVHVYADMRNDRQQLLDAYKDAIQVMQSVATKLDAQTERSEAEDLDLMAAISDFQNRQTGYDAALKTYSIVQQMSLFEYLR